MFLEAIGTILGSFVCVGLAACVLYIISRASKRKGVWLLPFVFFLLGWLFLPEMEHHNEEKQAVLNAMIVVTYIIYSLIAMAFLSMYFPKKPEKKSS